MPETNVYSNVLDESHDIKAKSVYEFFMSEDKKRSIPFAKTLFMGKNNINDYLNDLKNISNDSPESSWFLVNIYH